MGQDVVIRSGKGGVRSEGGLQRRIPVDHGAHLLSDRVNEPDVQVLLRADTCGKVMGQGKAGELLLGNPQQSLL